MEAGNEGNWPGTQKAPGFVLVALEAAVSRHSRKVNAL